MPFAFGHLIGAWTFGKIKEKITKKNISHYTWFFLLLGGILPDSDLILQWVFGWETHRHFTHSLFFAVAMALLVYLLFYKNQEKKNFALAIGGGVLVHILLDSLFIPGVPLLWPWNLYFSWQGVSFLNLAEYSMVKSAETMQKTIHLAIFDMGLGTAWIFYLWFKRRIKF